MAPWNNDSCFKKTTVCNLIIDTIMCFRSLVMHYWKTNKFTSLQIVIRMQEVTILLLITWQEVVLLLINTKSLYNNLKKKLSLRICTIHIHCAIIYIIFFSEIDNYGYQRVRKQAPCNPYNPPFDCGDGLMGVWLRLMKNPDYADWEHVTSDYGCWPCPIPIQTWSLTLSPTMTQQAVF